MHAGGQIGEVAVFLLLEVAQLALLHDLAILDDGNTRTLLDCGQSVGNHDRCAVLHYIFEGFLHLRLTDFVKSACRFVKEEYLGLAHDCASDRHALLLPTGELVALHAANDIEALVEGE